MAVGVRVGEAPTIWVGVAVPMDEVGVRVGEAPTIWVGEAPTTWVGVAVMLLLVSEMSSNQMLPFGKPSVIRRKVTLVFVPLFQLPVLNCQLPLVVAHNWASPAISFMSMHEPPLVEARQM